MRCRSALLGLLFAMSLGCASEAVSDSVTSNIGTPGFNDLNLAAGSMILYEVQVRAANACDPNVGSAAQKEACAAKAAPHVRYRAEGMSCNEESSLERIKLGTLDDMLEDTADYKQGITLRYIKDRVGATTVWLMPLFPNNDTWSIPSACDNLGSPYAVRDYMHASGMLSRACIQAGADEHDDNPCWGNASLDAVIDQAHRRGLKVMLDVALNHFGHNYAMYDYGTPFRSIRSRATSGEDLNALWNFDKTFEDALMHPTLLDNADQLQSAAQKSDEIRAALDAVRAKCPNFDGDQLVRAVNAWRDAFDNERGSFTCDPTKNFLEFQASGYYLGKNAFDPSSQIGDNFTNDWRDVKFLFHHEENTTHQWEFVREREYLFRIMNYWVSRGIDGFRLDHTTDPQSGMGSNEWKYLTSKVDYYAFKRGQQRPVYLAEEFGDQQEMNKVVDIMTEGYVGNMNGRNGATKDASFVQGVLENNNRFQNHAFVMTALEDHDEDRLLNGTGFNIWTGAGFWGIGATTRSTPMLLMGQEFGAPTRLQFRKSDYVRARFDGSGESNAQGEALVDFYHALTADRLRPENRALLAPNHFYLQTRDTNSADPRIFAAAKWSDDKNVVFVFHNLWEQDVAQSYFIDPNLARTLGIDDNRSYRLVDIISTQVQGPCHTGADLKSNFFVKMDAGTRAQWLRLEQCN